MAKIINATAEGYSSAISGGGRVTLSNSTEHTGVKGFVVGGTGGTINLTFADGSEVDGIPVLAGVWYQARVTMFRTGGSVTDVWLLR